MEKQQINREEQQQDRELSRLKRIALQVASGGSAGFVEVCIMQPLDVVKTRMQLQNTTSSAVTEFHYHGVFDCFGKMYQKEGLLAFWKGIMPPILAETPKRAIKFVTFEQTKPLFMFGAPSPTPLTFSMAGFTAGLIEGLAVTPFEVVKITQQADHRKMKDAPTTWSVTRHILRTEGFGSRGLTKGLTATMARGALFNMVYFGFYHSVKSKIPVYDDNAKEFLKKISIGFTSGTLACFVNIPFDVAKSRIQGPQPSGSGPGVIKYKSTLGSIRLVYKEEGILALWKGLIPKVMRLGPGGAIMLVVFEHTYDYLRIRFA